MIGQWLEQAFLNLASSILPFLYAMESGDYNCILDLGTI